MNSHNSSALRNSVKVAGDVKITYQYNSLGHRSKKVSYDLLGNIEKETAYTRDASGKLLSIYSGPTSGNLKQVEIPIYGASRLGMLVMDDNFEQEQYELKDHLGNIRTIVKHPTDTAPSITLGYSDYYPFGLRMVRYTNPGYRFGFQGDFAEDDTEENGFNVFEARLYDPVLGRWTTVDPARQFASGYVGMGNDPIGSIDTDGRESGDPRGNAFFSGLYNIFTSLGFRESKSNTKQTMKEIHDVIANPDPPIDTQPVGMLFIDKTKPENEIGLDLGWRAEHTEILDYTLLKYLMKIPNPKFSIPPSRSIISENTKTAGKFLDPAQTSQSITENWIESSPYYEGFLTQDSLTFFAKPDSILLREIVTRKDTIHIVVKTSHNGFISIGHLNDTIR
ncbi:RHS repeat-associated core domain-containing protein [Persicobacter diffluens]|uniref:RHS repeat domain-containing protein n=1 Tax=Persicobacter diffluens TaxID=981 RepID=UPI0030C7468B